MSIRPTKTGQKVMRVPFPFGEPELDSMLGCVAKIKKVKGSGGSKAIVRVIWASGSEATHQDHTLAVVEN
jgi:hypothetical protein